MFSNHCTTCRHVYALHFLLSIICIVFHILYYILCILRTVWFALYSIYWDCDLYFMLGIICSAYNNQLMNNILWILSIVFKVLNWLHLYCQFVIFSKYYIQWTAYYALNYIYCNPCILILYKYIYFAFLNITCIVIILY